MVTQVPTRSWTQPNRHQHVPTHLGDVDGRVSFPFERRR